MKKIISLFRVFFNTLSHPSHIAVIIKHYLRHLHPVKSDQEHLTETMSWLKRSQDNASGGGCAGVYTFKEGWRPPYPETTGYIIPTFIKYGELADSSEYLERAKKMGDWEIDIQLSSGAIRGGVGINEYPIVFNTGQVILGWVALYKKTGITRYKDAAEKAAKWLAENLDGDGKWSKNTFNGVPHAYNVRVAWAILEASAICGNNDLKEAAFKNVNWVLSQAKVNDWIEFMGFTLEEEPFTHTIAYTLRGLLECSAYADDELKKTIIGTIIKASDHIIACYDAKQGNKKPACRFIPGAFNNEWRPDNKFSCLTGNVQLAIIWMKLYKINGEKRYLDLAIRSIDQLKSTQDLSTKNNGIRGGVAGSYPIWGRYVNYGYPNWAAKFLADSIMLKMEIIKGSNY